MNCSWSYEREREGREGGREWGERERWGRKRKRRTQRVGRERGTGIGSDWRRRRCTRGGRDQETGRRFRLNLLNVPTFAESKKITVLKY